MRLADFAEQYGNFTVPNFQVQVGGQDLVRELFLSVPSAEVDLKEKTSGRFSFKVINAFDWELRSFVGGEGEQQIDLLNLFAFGTPVTIRMGYGEVGKLKTIFEGIITEVGTGFNEGQVPELSVSGYDGLYPLTTGRNTRSWEQAHDSDAVSELVGVTGLSPDVQQTDTVKPRIDQSQESDIAFLQKLAERNGATFYVRNRQFYFGPRNNSDQAVVELPWGAGLLSFSPSANLAQQVETVEVHGWSAERGEAIVGRASRDEQSGRDSGRRSGAEYVAEALNNQPVMRVRAAVHDQAEADSRARAILEERSQDFMTADGESIGLPEIVPDINIAFSDLGPAFSKVYYVNATVHQIDGNAYNTRFSMQETTL